MVRLKVETKTLYKVTNGEEELGVYRVEDTWLNLAKYVKLSDPKDYFIGPAMRSDSFADIFVGSNSEVPEITVVDGSDLFVNRLRREEEDG
jgi:hypothetical protein